MPKKYKDAVVTCEDCDTQFPRTAPNQKVCKDCRYQRNLAANRATYEDLILTLNAQGGVCPICLEPVDLADRRSDIDHCHNTGVVRGIVHDVCNRGIGMLGDDPARCERAAEYLRRYEPKAGMSLDAKAA